MKIMRRLLFLPIILAILLPFADATACVKSRKVLVEAGVSPIGEPWTVKAKKSRNGSSCDKWLFQVQFALPNVVGYAAGTSIPVGGHTPKDFTISALDAEGTDGLERAFSGYTGREVSRVIAEFGDGTRTEIVAKSPRKRLRETYVWMRGFRYFVYYYPAGSGVQAVTLVSRGGRVLYRATVEPGGYFL